MPCRARAPGTEVGGDRYDCFQFPDGRVALVGGDVIGKGLTPAGMGRVRSVLRALAFTDPEPVAVRPAWTGSSPPPRTTSR